MKAPLFLRANSILQVGLFILAALLVYSCKSTKMSQDAPPEPLEKLSQLAEEKLGKSTTTNLNKSKSHALVAATTSTSKTAKSIRFFVYEIASEKVMLEDFVDQGSVEWLDDHQIKVTKIPGRYGPQASKGYIFNIETMEKDQITL